MKRLFKKGDEVVFLGSGGTFAVCKVFEDQYDDTVHCHDKENHCIHWSAKDIVPLKEFLERTEAKGSS